MEYGEIAHSIINNCGGNENIVDVLHCTTRLRFTLQDNSKVQYEKIKETDQVMGVVNKGQLQLIFENDVIKIYDEILKILKKEDSTINKPTGNLLSVITAIFQPMIPIMTASGMLKAILISLVSLGVISEDNTNYKVLIAISEAGYYFLPILLALSTARKFKMNNYTAITLAGVLLYPALINLSNNPNGNIILFGFPMNPLNYTYTVFPVIITVIFAAAIEKRAKKYFPEILKFLTVPLFTLIISATVSLLFLAPIGGVGGNILVSIVTLIQAQIGWLAQAVMAFFMPFIVMFGMHKVLVPFNISAMNTVGYESLVLPTMLAANIAQGASSLAVSLKTKNRELRNIAFSAGITGICGITEPAIFGVNLKLKRPMLGAVIGAGCSGIFVGISNLKCYAFVAPSIATLPIFIGEKGNFENAIITVLISFVVAFASTWILGFKDEKSEEEVKSIKKDKVRPSIYAPMNGKIVPLSEVDDQVFSQKIMGDGLAIIPINDNVLVSPVNGVINKLFYTNHAIEIKSNDGLIMLIHIGIDTIKLDGKFFKSYISEGDVVKKGDKLVKFSSSKITAKGFDIITPIVIKNSEDYGEIFFEKNSIVEKGQKILTTI